MIYPDGSQVPEIDQAGYRLLYVQGRLLALEEIRDERWLRLDYYARRKEIEHEENLNEIQRLRILEGGKVRRLEKVHGNKGLRKRQREVPVREEVRSAAHERAG
jgi:hypothetical protein